MADNVAITAGSGTTIATDDIGGGVQVQRVKVTTGVDGTATDVSNANPVPVSDAGSSLTVDGTVGVSAVPADPFGTNADAAVAAGAAGSMQAKLRLTTTQLAAIQTAVETIDNIVSGAGINITQLAGTAMAVNSGNVSAGVQRVVLATDQPQLTNGLGNVGIVPRTTGGLTMSTPLIAAATTNATLVKGSAGQLYGWYIYNASASVRYVKLYNKASAPTVGTDTPVLVIALPPTAGANLLNDIGLAFSTGIAFAMTTGSANSDTGAVTAGDVIANFFYA